MASTSEDIARIRKSKEEALATGNYTELRRLREVEARLLEKQTAEFKPNRRGS